MNLNLLVALEEDSSSSVPKGIERIGAEEFPHCQCCRLHNQKLAMPCSYV